MRGLCKGGADGPRAGWTAYVVPMLPLLFNVLLLVVLAVSLNVRSWAMALAMHTIWSIVVVWVVATVGTTMNGWSVFALMQGVAWYGFLHGPVAWLVLARRATNRKVAVGLGLTALMAAAAGAWSALIEPRMLQVHREEFQSEKVTEAFTIALIADLQTDTIGDHELQAIAAAGGADLVLFAGDYLQVDDKERFYSLAKELHAALSTLRPRLGAFAVGGDVDVYRWEQIFQGTEVQPWETSTTLDLGPLVLTGLRLKDSRYGVPPIPVSEKLHVVFGHAPDYAMAAGGRADLLLAGHTHGGQVVLPGYGPLITFSMVPRAWASGRTELPDGGTLIVSRGIGMERLDAPRLRMFCPPEVVLIDVSRSESRRP